MSKQNILTELTHTKLIIYNLRARLLSLISKIQKDKMKIKIEEDQPLIYFEDGSIAVDTIVSNYVSGIDSNGCRHEIELADLSADDLQSIAERIYQENQS